MDDRLRLLFSDTKLVVCRSDYTCPIAENVDELVKGCHLLCTTIARFTHLMDLGIVRQNVTYRASSGLFRSP